MKHSFAVLALTSLFSFTMSVTGSAQIDMAKANALFNGSANPTECRTYLESVLPQAASGKEKAAVLCKLSETYLILGQNEPSKEKKREIFGKGIEYANQAIMEDPSNPDGYMWHSGNVGRECQTRSFTEQAKKLPVIMGDITKILDDLKITDYSAAWQAMGEIYMNHPMKSKDDAINYARKAVSCIPAGEMRITTYTLLARLLYDRNLTDTKRVALINKCKDKFNKKYDTITDKYAFYEGSLGADFKPVWSSKTLGTLSDREEAMAIVAYVKSMYEKNTAKTEHDKGDYKELMTLAQGWK